MDLISRQAAIDDIQKDRDASVMPEMWYEGVDYAIDHFRNLPTAEKKGEWIPCSERLPEEGAEVLWCTPSGYVCSGCMMLGRPIDDCGHQGNYIAWMPLPEPYKEGE